MWYEVKKLAKRGLNKSQISRETNLDRATVRKYLLMSEAEFHQSISNPRNIPLKLSSYMKFVKEELTKAPYLSAAQIEDRLKEHFTNLPSFHSKTVYNFVQTVRREYDIPKPKKEDLRYFEHLPETAYGEQSQVDFGEAWMQNKKGKREKVYFFAIVLSRSRYKFVYFENKPFTSSSAVYAHKLAFKYFKGITKEIIYDQDNVFIHDENLGDYLLTEEFSQFSKFQGFVPNFCRKADPQSKGKVESIVKYVKQNFLRGRKYIDIKNLNKEAKEWLNRTANAKQHGTTKKIPFEQWKEEKKYLLPVKSKQVSKEDELCSYNVRKDNTISYKGNFYSLPLDTYKNAKSSVLLKEKENKLIIYTMEKKLLTTHSISLEKGKYIRNTDHSRKKSKTIKAYYKKALETLGNTEQAKEFLNLLKKDKPRYIRDNLEVIISKTREYPKSIIQESLLLCIDNKLLNANTFTQIVRNKFLEQQKIKQASQFNIKKIEYPKNKDIETEEEIETSNINTYEKILNSCKN